MQNYILSTDKIISVYYSSQASRGMNIIFIEFKIVNMLIKVKIYSYTPSRYRLRVGEESTANQNLLKKESESIKIKIQEKLVKIQQRSLASKNLPHDVDLGLIESNLTNYIARKGIKMPILSHIFVIRIPTSIFSNTPCSDDLKKKIESFFFGLGLKTDLYAAFNKKYLEKNFGLQLANDLQIRFSLIRNEELEHLRCVNRSVCYFSRTSWIVCNLDSKGNGTECGLPEGVVGDFGSPQFGIREFTLGNVGGGRGDGEEDFYQFNLFYAYKDQRIYDIKKVRRQVHTYISVSWLIFEILYEILDFLTFL